MLATLKEVLQEAEDKKIAIGAFDTPNLESLCAAIAAARGSGASYYYNACTVP
ncbi:MAG: hypothetical protein V8S01_09775 [Dorea sp.]